MPAPTASLRLRAVLPLLLAALPRSAAAVDPSLAISTVHQACTPILAEAGKALRKDPDDLSARLREAECAYAIGRLDLARADLDRVFAGRPLSDSLVLGDSRGVPRDRQGDMVALWSVVLSLQGEPALARAALDGGRQAFGDTAGMARATAVLVAKKGQLSGAWTLSDQVVQRWPRDPAARAVCAELASLDPSHVTPACLGLLSEKTEKAGAYNRAVMALNEGHDSDCLAEVERARGEQPRAEWPAFLPVGHACAVQAGLLPEADRYLEELGGLAAASPEQLVTHADLLRRAGRSDEALRMIEAAKPSDPTMRAEASTLHLRLLTEAGRLDEALKLAYAEPTGPVTRAVLATALRKAGRAKEAWNLLTQTCPELRGPDAAQCYEVLGRLKE